MKTLKHIGLLALLAIFATSCCVTVIEEDDFLIVDPQPTPVFSLNQDLQSKAQENKHKKRITKAQFKALIKSSQ